LTYPFHLIVFIIPAAVITATATQTGQGHIIFQIQS